MSRKITGVVATKEKMSVTLGGESAALLIEAVGSGVAWGRSRFRLAGGGVHMHCEEDATGWGMMSYLHVQTLFPPRLSCALPMASLIRNDMLSPSQLKQSRYNFL